jgi:hypothetical protein
MEGVLREGWKRDNKGREENGEMSRPKERHLDNCVRNEI